MNERKPSPRKRWRWWLALPVLALLIAGGVIWYRYHVGPLLQPIASYRFPAKSFYCPLVFSAQGMGYPAVARVMVQVAGNLKPRYRVLDDQCRTLDVTVNFGNVSPTREIVVWSTFAGKNGKFDFHFRRRDGRQASVVCPSYGLQDVGLLPCSDGVVSYTYTPESDGIDRVWLYTPAGHTILSSPLAGGLTIPYGIGSADDRFVPLTDRKRLLLYDCKIKKIVLGTSFAWDQTAMIWQHRDRLLLVPRFGHTVIYDRLRHTHTINPGADGWRWCEDGTVWTLESGELQVLRWRNGTPKLVPIRTRGTPGTRYGSMAPGLQSIPPFRENTDPDWAAVWGDGKLVASVESLAPADTQLIQTALRVAQRLHLKLNIHRDARRLTLYRDNHLIGSFLLPTKSQPPPPPPTIVGPRIRRSLMHPWRPPNTANHEHLAFTKDGKYLSWAIDDGEGVRLIVFEVPES